MRIRAYRDKSSAHHLDLVGAGSSPWTLDLVQIASAAILVVGFVCALVVQVI
jgi:hypothetical protein